LERARGAPRSATYHRIYRRESIEIGERKRAVEIVKAATWQQQRPARAPIYPTASAAPGAPRPAEVTPYTCAEAPQTGLRKMHVTVDEARQNGLPARSRTSVLESAEQRDLCRFDPTASNPSRVDRDGPAG